MLVDTHAHLYLDAFEDDLENVLRRAEEAGVKQIVLPAIDVPSIRSAVRLCDKYNGLFAMAALHPSETNEATPSDFDQVTAWCEHEKIVAVGESGLDYYWDRSFDDRQEAFLRQHVRLAIETDLPLILHNREATRKLIEVITSEREASQHPERLRGIFHCFVDDAETARTVRELGFYVGLGGIMTFSNSEVHEHVRNIPLEQIVLETDAPYLAPEPHRGDRNESAYVRDIANFLAELKNISFDEVASVTTKNAQAVYQLPANSKLVMG